MNELAIASYIDRGMSAADRDRAEDHMADCSECRRNVAEAEQLVRRLRRPRRFVELTSIAAVAAAGLIVFSPKLLQRGPQDRITRDAEAEALTAHQPVAGAFKSPVRFVWGAASDAISYRITLSTADGSRIWSASITDTTAVLPPDVTLQPGTTYVWFADAIRADGSAQTTGLHPIVFEGHD